MTPIRMVGAVLLITFGSLLFILFMADCIVWPLTLVTYVCNGYRSAPVGAGEMTYCILEPEDDDMNFEFFMDSANTKRKDSVACLVPTPIKMFRQTRKMSGNIKSKDFERYHYLFPKDSVKGTITCENKCIVTVGSKTSSCANYWDNSVYNLSKVDFLSKTGKGCHSTYTDLFEHEGKGSIPFQVTAKVEGPFYITIESPEKDKKPTAAYEYTLEQTHIDVSTSVMNCSDYNCFFTNLSTTNRTKTYVAVNVFSDYMQGEYELMAYYRPNKNTNIKLAIGFGIATGISLVFTIIGGIIFGVAPDD